MNNKKSRAKEIQKSIQEVLLKDWDPIGIKAEPEAQDEYDGYIGSIYRLLVSNPTEEKIINHLYQIETEEMGMSPFDKEKLKNIAQKLLSINVKL